MRFTVHVHDSTGAVIGGELETKRKRRRFDQPLIDNLIARLLGQTGDEAAGHKFHGNQYVEVAGQNVEVPITGTLREKLVHLFMQGHKFTLKELAAVLNANEITIRGRLSEIKNSAPPGGLYFDKSATGHYSLKKKEGTLPPPPAPAPAPKTEAQIAKEKFEAARTKANEASSSAKTEKEHLAAAQLFRDAIEASKSHHEFGQINARIALWEGVHKHRTAAGELQKLREKEEKKQAKHSPEGKSKAAIEARFEKHSVAEIDQHFRSKYGLGFANGASDRAFKAMKKAYRKDFWNRSTEENEKLHEQVELLRKKTYSDPGARIRGHSGQDVEDGSAGAKTQRKMLGHIDDALSKMVEAGFDVKAALSKGKVSIAAGTTSKNLGHAWQNKNLGIGYFSISPKNLDLDEQVKRAEARKEAGKPMWTTAGLEEDGGRRGTIIHELTHALGMQHHIDSPSKVSSKLAQLFPDYPTRRAWIKANISEYACTNSFEVDAELCAKVTSPTYVRGTLPKVLEDHVDSLWGRKS